MPSNPRNEEGPENRTYVRRQSFTYNDKNSSPRRKNFQNKSSFVLPSIGIADVSPVIKTGTPVTNFFRAVRHVHQARERFRCELIVEKLIIRVPRAYQVNLEWIRGKKKAVGSTTNTLCQGTSSVSWPENVVMNATLFKGNVTNRGGANSYKDKETIIRFVEASPSSSQTSPMNRKKGIEILGEHRLDLAESVQTPNVAARWTVPLSNCLDPHARLTFTLHCSSLGDEGCSSSETHLTQDLSVEEKNGGSQETAPQEGLRKRSSLRKTLFDRKREKTELLSANDLTVSKQPRRSSLGEAAAENKGPVNSQPPSQFESNEPDLFLKTVSPGLELASFRAGDGASSRSPGGQSSAKNSTDPSSSRRRTAREGSRTKGDEGQAPTHSPMDPNSRNMEKLLALQTELAKKDEELDRVRRGYEEKVNRLEESLNRQVVDSKSALLELNKKLGGRDEQVSELLAQLNEMHNALERAQKMHSLDKQILMSATNKESDELVVRLTEENHLLNQRLQNVNSELDAANQLLRNENNKHGRRIAELEAVIVQMQKNHEQTTTALELQLVSATGYLKTVENDKKLVDKAFEASEREAAELRLRWLNEMKTDEKGKNLIYELQAEVEELTKMKRLLQQKRVEDQHAFNEEIRNMQNQNKTLRRELDYESRLADVEKRELRKRMSEMERAMALKEAGQPLTLKEQLAMEDTRNVMRKQGIEGLADMTREELVENLLNLNSTVKQSERNLKRIGELEEELIKTKVQLAESKTEHEELMGRAKTKVDSLRKQMKEQNETIIGLESECTKLKLRRAEEKKKKTEKEKKPAK